MSPQYHPPVKRSIAIEGHKTSISLEPVFWDMLKRAAAEADIPVSRLVAQIDAERIQSDTPPGLASAIRVWLVAKGQARCT
ncbi:MAG: ribbon-helix-helix domain-containing protein [Pseudomonadota bacterium]